LARREYLTRAGTYLNEEGRIDRALFHKLLKHEMRIYVARRLSESQV
jgi:hypothetical protein